MEHPSSSHKNQCLAIVPYIEFDLKKLIKEYNTQYNIDNSPLVALAPEILEKVLSQIDTLDDALKTTDNLRATCTYFNNLPLEHFGKAFQSYKQEEKNKKLEDHMSSEHMILKYWGGRSRALILKLSGAQENPYSFHLMGEIISHNDTEALTCLLEKNIIDPNKKFCGMPIFYNTKTIKIAEILKKNGCNLHAQGGRSSHNVLWHHISKNNPSPKLVAYYLNHNVDAETINISDGNCLLHLLADSSSSIITTTIDDYLETASLLLKVVPNLINHLNIYNQTPIDVAQKRWYETEELTHYAHTHGIKESFNKLIILFQQHGGKTANQLEHSKKQDQKFINKIKALPYNDYSRE